EQAGLAREIRPAQRHHAVRAAAWSASRDGLGFDVVHGQRPPFRGALPPPESSGRWMVATELGRSEALSGKSFHPDDGESIHRAAKFCGRGIQISYDVPKLIAIAGRQRERRHFPLQQSRGGVAVIRRRRCPESKAGLLTPPSAHDADTSPHKCGEK